MMSELDEKHKRINEKAVLLFQDWLKRLDECGDNKEGVEEDMVAHAYASLIAVYVAGYSPERLAADAVSAGVRVLILSGEYEDD
jgi:hypothetical protein